MTEFHDWEDVRAELDDGDRAALGEERARTEEWAREGESSHGTDGSCPVTRP
jgi:hypothetical protein